ncbi:MAG TPA: histidine phosphatase family protein [Candidatus Limnocylindria bacterium]|nr:histidine phosphatase family protein [Candidatus Limnocylindria bacterium]
MRHGESEGNAARIFTGHLDSPLTETGRRQAAAVAEALAAVKVDRVISSDLARARDTAEAIARRHGLTVETFPELREIDLGEMAGRSFDDARAHPDWSEDGFVQWPGGESLDAVFDRAFGLVSRIVAESPGRTVVVVGHGGVTRILVSHFLGLLPRLERARAANANITKVIVVDGRFTVEQLFDDAHIA